MDTDLFKEFESVTLLQDVAQGDESAKAGEIGTIVHMYPGIDVFMVEFNHGVVYECDLLNLRRDQVRPTIKDDFEREKHDLAERARAAGRTHNFSLFNFVTLTEDVSEGDTTITAGALGSVEEVYKDTILVEFRSGIGNESIRMIVQPHQARLATEEDFERERHGQAQGVAD